MPSKEGSVGVMVMVVKEDRLEEMLMGVVVMKVDLVSMRVVVVCCVHFNLAKELPLLILHNSCQVYIIGHFIR